MIEVELRGPVRIEAEIGKLKVLPPIFSNEDEGKVVDDGELVSQTPHATVTQNGVVDTTLNDSVEVAVPGPSGTKDIYVTRNGETTRDVEDYEFARIHADVPNSYSAADEGKVVDDGELVAQTPHATVTQNGVVDTTLNDSVEVAVPASAVDSGTKAISTNGTHDVVGYAAANVNVPNSYAAGDEGKVVHNGSLVSQTAHADVILNGTIDTTYNNSVKVAVPSPTGTKKILIEDNGMTTEDVTNYASAEIAVDVPASKVDSGTKSIGSNGSHSVIGYAFASVNVPNSYSASDEGKVVDDGELVSQTPHATVTQNGVVDTTLNDSVEVAVPASAVDSGTKSISTNGTHDVVGYASASVNVPNSYSASDEGKVVSNGALIAQVAHALVTANGVIDTTLNNSVEIAVPSGGIEFPSDWFVDSWTQASDSQSKTWTHGLGQQPHFVVCICLDSTYGSNGRIMDMAFAKPDGTWVQSGVASANSNETSAYWSQSIGYNGYTIDNTTITLTQGRYYSATFKAGKKYLLLAHK